MQLPSMGGKEHVMRLPNTKQIAMFAFAVMAGGCGFWANPFTPMNGGPSENKVATTATFDIDCRDTPKASGATSIVGVGESAMNAGQAFYAACTHQGKPLPWKVLGVFHAGYTVTDWEEWRRDTVERAKSRGCPGVALRTFPPTSGDLYDMVGALCVDPGVAAN